MSVIELSEITAMISAGQTSYALLSNGTVRSWGANLKEELGGGSGALPVEEKNRKAAFAPVPVKEASTGDLELTGVTEIAAAYGDGTHAIALVNDSEHEGEVVTWGASEFGQRGISTEEKGKEKLGTLTPRDKAVFVPVLKHIVAVAAGGNSDYALENQGGTTTVWAWGENAFGKLGIGKTTGGEECEGEGENLKQCSTIPVRVEIPEGLKVTAIAAGKEAAYAVLSNGKVLSWGRNEHAQLGDDGKTGSLDSSDKPVYVCAVGASAPCEPSSELEGITKVSGGDKFALALTTGDEVIGWGANGDGNLTGSSSEECSVSEKTCQKVPKKLSGLENVSALSAGGGYSLALIKGTVYGWGRNDGGQLGLGLKVGPETCIEETSCSRTPKPVEGLPPVAGIAAGASETGEGHSLAFLESGSGPPPLMTTTPEAEAIKVTWRFGSPTRFVLDYKLEASKEWTQFASLEGLSCSAASPCSDTITPLAPNEKMERYEVRLQTIESAKITSERIGAAVVK